MFKYLYLNIKSQFNTGITFSVLCIALALTLFCMPACSDTKDFLGEGKQLMDQGNPAGAVVFFKNALDEDPTNFEVRFSLAKAYMKLGKLEQAEEELLKCLLQKSEDPELNLEMAKVMFITGKAETALSHLRTMAQHKAHTAESKELEALVHSRLGNIDKAEQCLTEALKIDPEYAAATIGLARVNMIKKRPEQALKLIESLLAKRPGHIEAYRVRADLAMTDGDLHTAEKCYKKIVELSPSDEGAHYMHCMVLLRQDKMEQATAARDTMLGIFKETPRVYMLNGIIAFQKENFADAATFFQNSVDAAPSLEGYYRLALALQRMGNSESALSNLRRLLDISPQHSQALALTSKIYLSQNRLQDALAEAEKLAGFYPDSAQAHQLLGNVQNALGDTKASLASFQRALEIDPDMSDAMLARSAILMSEKRFDEAAGELSRAMKTESGNVQARAAMANYHLGRNDANAAEKVLLEGLVELPDNPVLLTIYASIDASRGQEAEALKKLKTASERDPNYIPALSMSMRLHMVAGRNAKALELCEAYLERHPDDVDRLIASAALYEVLGNPEETEARLTKAYRLGSGRAFSFLVQRELAANRRESAEALFVEAMKNSPGPELRARFADFYLTGSQFDKAWELYHSIETASPGESALGKFRLLSAAGRHEEALEQAKIMQKLEPSSSMGAVCAANALEQMNAPDKALSQLEKAYRDKGETQLLVAMGQLCSRQNQFKKAEVYFNSALKHNPKDLAALSGLGLVYMRQKKFTSAISAYERALEIAPAEPAVVNNLAMAYAEEGEKTKMAVQLATKAYVQWPENHSILDTLGFCLLADKRPGDAVQVLRNGLKHHPNSALIHYRLGSALAQAGMPAEAKVSLNKALEIGSFNEKDQARALISKLD